MFPLIEPGISPSSWDKPKDHIKLVESISISIYRNIYSIYIYIYSHHFPINMHWKLIQASKLLYRLLLIYPIIAHHIHIPYLMVSYIISHPFISPNSDWFVAEITMFHWTITQRHNRRHDEAVCLACPSRPSMAMGNFREASHAQTYGGFLNWYPAGWFSLKSYSNGWVWDLLLTMVTSSTAQGGCGSFKNRKPIGEIGCCESGMAERSHWWIERRLISLTLSLTVYLPTYLSLYLAIYLSLSLFHLITLSIYLSIDLSISLSLFHLSICLAVYLSIYLSIYLSLSFIGLSV